MTDKDRKRNPLWAAYDLTKEQIEELRNQKAYQKLKFTPSDQFRTVVAIYEDENVQPFNSNRFYLAVGLVKEIELNVVTHECKAKIFFYADDDEVTALEEYDDTDDVFFFCDPRTSSLTPRSPRKEVPEEEIWFKTAHRPNLLSRLYNECVLASRNTGFQTRKKKSQSSPPTKMKKKFTPNDEKKILKQAANMEKHPKQRQKPTLSVKASETKRSCVPLRKNNQLQPKNTDHVSTPSQPDGGKRLEVSPHRYNFDSELDFKFLDELCNEQSINPSNTNFSQISVGAESRKKSLTRLKNLNQCLEEAPSSKELKRMYQDLIAQEIIIFQESIEKL